MTDGEFQELVAEVKHLGRLPKPVVVRPIDDQYVIVDGEHAWRAAKEVGLAEIPCEVVEADDFEAMRQTYKRNQHGTHDPVALGRMFHQMMEGRGLSQRRLATEIAVSAGTVRNALIYADAADLRNSYAFEDLSIRQVRTYLSLPECIRDVWLDAGADLKALDDALTVPRAYTNRKGQKIDCDYSEDPAGAFEGLREVGLLDHISAAGPKAFVATTQHAFVLWEWRREYAEYWPSIDDYARPVAKLQLPLSTLDFLPCEGTPEGIIPLIPADRWASILQDCDKRSDNADERDDMIAACIRMALHKTGKSLNDVGDPRIAEWMGHINNGPSFIRESNLSLADKLRLATAKADVPDDVLLEAQKEACDSLIMRDAVLTGTLDGFAKLDSPIQEYLRQCWQDRTADDLLEAAIEQIMSDRKWKESLKLFADRDALTNSVVKKLKEYHVIREGTVDGRPAWQILDERLRQLPLPEFVLLASYALGDDEALGATGRWFHQLEGKKMEGDLPCDDSDGGDEEQK